MKKCGGNPGRGSHRLAMAASDVVYELRECAADFFNADPENVVITGNATHSLNMAIRGLVGDGEGVLISDLEHNSVLRCVEYMKKRHGVSYEIFSSDGDVIENIRRKIGGKSAVICLHSSNIVNKTLPIEKIGKLCLAEGVKFIVDASQSAGVIDIDIEKNNINALCLPGHKGLLGPQGIGLAIFSDNTLPETFMYGGSGVNSKEITMPDFLPDRLEAGTVPTPCAAGLTAGIKYVSRLGLDNIREHEKKLADMLYDAFSDDDKIEIYGERGGGLFLFNVRDIPSTETAAYLDSAGIATRAGLHCAPLAHLTLKTPESGAVRASVGVMNTEKEIAYFVDVLKKYTEKVRG